MTEKGPAEKRKLPRLDGITFPVKYNFKKNPNMSMRGRVMSIGESGLTITTEEILPVGTELRLNLYLPGTLFPFSNWQTVSAEARIIRVHDKPGSDGFRRYGVLIMQISGQDATTLKNCISLSLDERKNG